jgi:DNA-directed RNA polymerase specialized sigma24 family protein
MRTSGGARTDAVLMDDDAALLELGAGDSPGHGQGDSPARRAAKEAIAIRYHAKLMTVLRRQFMYEPEAAGHAATAALIRLYKKAQIRPGSVSAENNGVWRWLLKTAGDAARDFCREARRHRPDDVADPPASLLDEGGDGRHGGPNPAELTVAREAAQRALDVILDLPQPDRGILLHDMRGEFEHLTGDDRALHDQELIDCTKDHGVWSRDALRSARTRVRKTLEALRQKGQL